jgi:hypothetical protein
MNERIRQLAEQASKEAFPVGSMAWMETFAELIVQKCLDQCYNRGMNDAFYAGQLQAASYIEEYFGVES